MIGWCLAGYTAALFGALPVAVSCWNGWVDRMSGGLLSVEQVHVVEYALWGWLASLCARAGRDPQRSLRTLVIVGMSIGFLEERAQVFVPRRFFQWSDVALNWFGLFLGVGVIGAAGWLAKAFAGRKAE